MAIICHLDCNDRFKNKNFIGHIKSKKNSFRVCRPCCTLVYILACHTFTS